MTIHFRSKPVVSLFLVLGVACSHETSSDDAPYEDDKSALSTVGTEGGDLQVEAGRLMVPEGALSADTTIEVLELTPLEVDKLTVEPQGTDLAGEAVAFLPHGLVFSVPAGVQLTYDETAGSRFAIGRLSDPSDTDWEFIEGATFEGGVASFQISSFSVYAVLSLEDEVSPGVGGSDASTPIPASGGGLSSGPVGAGGNVTSTETSSGGDQAAGSGGAAVTGAGTVTGGSGGGPLTGGTGGSPLVSTGGRTSTGNGGGLALGSGGVSGTATGGVVGTSTGGGTSGSDGGSNNGGNGGGPQNGDGGSPSATGGFTTAVGGGFPTSGGAAES